METLKRKAYDLLRRSERIFKTDMVYLVKNGSWLGFGQVASALLSLGLSLFFANAVSKDVYGNYKYIIAATGILGAISLSGLSAVVTQGVAQGSDRILKDAVRTSLRWGWLIVIAALSAALYYFYKDNIVLAVSMLIAGTCLPFMNAYSLSGGVQTGRRDFKGYTIYSTLGQLFTVVSLIIVAVITQNVLILVTIYFVSNLIADVVIYKRVLTTFKINDTADESLIPYSKHLSLINLLGTIANSLDKVLVFHYLGAIELAVYSFAQAIPEQLRGALKNLFGLAFPKYAALSNTDLRQSVKNKVLQLTALVAVISLAYILVAPLLFKLLFPKYLESVIYSQIYALGLIVFPGISLFNTYFQLKKDTRTLYILNTTGNIVTIILTFIFIYKFGLKGAVIENGTSWLVMFLIAWFYFARDKSFHEKVLV